MTQMIDVGIVIGFFLILLNFAEFLIRPHQAEAIKSFLEDLTLWVDDIDVSTLSNRLAEPEVHILLFLTGYTGYLLFILVSAVISFLIPAVVQAPVSFPQVDIARLALGLILPIFVVLIFWRMPFKQIISWAIASDSPVENRIKLLRMRPVLLFLGGMLVFLYLDFHLKQIPEHSEWWHIPIAVFAYITFAVAFTISVAKQLLRQHRGFLPKAVLFVSKQFLWRLVEYQKGPVAALVLILTTLLIVVRGTP